ncbi:hypothetical protein MLD38_029125 [Melastoma candidum]|uniref:Uncharacterized protein n=1 Tax=Melastoma candidum TaxID=119954 RepID=A0ACB9N2S1_9MYRT|nr:hypothetical protein MLD38_029125 [Melastoma candidum]
MSFANLSAFGATQTEEGNNTFNTLFRQTVSKEPLISLPRSAESPVQWIQLLHALDHQEYPGWPLLSPLKVPMQKCEKCSREYFSTINQRRHLRVYHRLKKLDKDTGKNRELLGSFWDKLSVNEAMEILSLKNSGMEDVPGAAVIKSLASLIRKPGFPVVPQVYIRAGSALLDIVQASPSRFPLSSQELFGILDDASEKTFLSGPTLMMQKYIFDKDAGKIGLETKNLVAFTSFFLEQKLVNAWMADKDAEALRCQKLLVEEEEAAQRRQAELLEKKRLRRLRQKEQKAKGNKSGEILDVNDSYDMMEAEPPTETSAHRDNLVKESQDSSPALATVGLHTYLLPDNEEDVDFEVLPELENGYTNSGGFKNARLLRPPGDSHQHTHAASWTVQRRFRGVPGVLNEVYRNSSSKPEFKHRHGNQDSKNSNINSKKVWSRKSKPDKESEDLNSRVHEAFPEADQGKKCEVLIGSIAVALGGGNALPINTTATPRNNDLPELQVLRDDGSAKASRPSTAQSNHSRGKLWRLVSRNGVKDTDPDAASDSVSHVVSPSENGEWQGLSNEDHIRLSPTSCSGDAIEPTSGYTESEILKNSEFSSHSAKAFLTQRWKEAIAAEHVELVLLPESVPPGSPGTDRSANEGRSDTCESNAPRNLNVNASDLIKVDKTKPDKSLKKKYVPKQR